MILSGELPAVPGAFVPGLVPSSTERAPTFCIEVLADDSLDGSWSPWRRKAYPLGQAVQLAARVYVEGVLTDQVGLTVVLEDDAGATVAAAPLQHDGTGLYHSVTLLPTTASPGAWVATWSKAGQAVAQRRFYVDKLA